jgi:hypothetical protein
MADFELSNTELEWVVRLREILKQLDAELGADKGIPGILEFTDSVNRYIIREYSRRRRAEKSRPKSA